MGRRRKFGRKLDGVLVVNKHAGETSNAVLQRAKRLFFAQKAGHTGALDPLATGVLPLCFGEATKFSQFLLDADKVYRSVFELGVVSDTADADGEILQEQSAAAISQSDVEAAMAGFRGEIAQVPPMYSALKVNGQPLYKLARQGIEIERKARSVTIYRYELLSFEAGERAYVEVEIACTKGTYVRSLAADLGEKLGCGARVFKLHRVKSGAFDESMALDLEALEQERGEERAEVLDHHLHATDAPVASLPKIEIDDDSGFYFCRGQRVMDTRVYQIADEGDTVRVFEESGRFLGLAEITDDGCLAPKRLVV
ncbi:tRNA pseudouridine(55) synthase TruB [Agaribacterium haliotis]|uniref:tRNA pseudouridine(55) synthase TruB n=1 Tax=Agaribacterium haliotis TaxID=2013869 RepID=UPI000BB53E04|nr:tRNA pseudouridine(55) synthase TruB [Agaribacterium haliotis]